MERTDVVPVPRIGLGLVKELVKREVQSRKAALIAAKGWIPHRKWEQENRQFLDLNDWLRGLENVT